MNSVDFIRAIWACNNTQDENVIRENVEKIIETNDPYLICDFIENVKKVHTAEYIKLFEDAIISIGDIVHIYEFMFLLNDMGIKDFDLKRFEEIIRNSGNPKLMLYCLGFVEGIDKESMLQALYATKNAKYIELLSTNEEYEALEASERPEYAEQLEIAKKFNYFPKSLEGFNPKTDSKVDISDLINQIIQLEDDSQEQRRKKAYLINELANYIEYLIEYQQENYDVKTLKESVNFLQEQEVKVAENEPLHLYEFAASVNSENKDSIIDKVVENNKPKYIHYCLEYVPNVSNKSQEKLKRTLLKSNNAKYTEGISVGEDTQSH